MTNKQDIQTHYQALEKTRGFVALCSMHLPCDMRDKRVLDVGCRNGKGVQKISSRVGEWGSVVGLDWDEGHVDQAQSQCASTMERNGSATSNMSFCLGYPEDLAEAGLEAESFDMVYCNSALNLFFDPQVALEQFAWVLVSGGKLVLDTVIANGERDPQVVKAARQLGNAIQAAPTLRDLEAMLQDVGFEVRMSEVMNPVDPSAGAEEGDIVPVAQSAEDLAFYVVKLEAYKE